MRSLSEEAVGCLRRVSIMGCEQTVAQFKAVILTEHQPSATSLVLVTKFAPFELLSAGDDFHSDVGLQDGVGHMVPIACLLPC